MRTQTKAQADREKFDLALVRYGKVIRTFSRNSFFHVPNFDQEDMEQELLGILYSAVQAYDPTRGAFFNSFVQQCFRNHIGKLRSATTRAKRSGEVVSLDVEAVQLAVDARRSLPSAEDILIEREDLCEAYRQAPARLQRRFASDLAEAG